jgi:hypothetical protein
MAQAVRGKLPRTKGQRPVLPEKGNRWPSRESGLAFHMSQMASLPFREAIEFLRKLGRDVGDYQRVISFVFQFKHVTDPMNLGD